MTYDNPRVDKNTKNAGRKWSKLSYEKREKFLYDFGYNTGWKTQAWSELREDVKQTFTKSSLKYEQN